MAIVHAEVVVRQLLQQPAVRCGTCGTAVRSGTGGGARGVAEQQWRTRARRSLQLAQPGQSRAESAQQWRAAARLFRARVLRPSPQCPAMYRCPPHDVLEVRQLAAGAQHAHVVDLADALKRLVPLGGAVGTCSTGGTAANAGSGAGACVAGKERRALHRPRQAGAAWAWSGPEHSVEAAAWRAAAPSVSDASNTPSLYVMPSMEVPVT